MIYLPKFVKLNNTCLRLVNDKYYRDGGAWQVGYKMIDNQLVSWQYNLRKLGLHKIPLIECTEKEWRDDNGIYAPDLNYDYIVYQSLDGRYLGLEYFEDQLYGKMYEIHLYDTIQPNCILKSSIQTINQLLEVAQGIYYNNSMLHQNEYIKMKPEYFIVKKVEIIVKD